MANVAKVVEYLTRDVVPAALPAIDYSVVQTPTGPEIVVWNVTRLGAKPSVATIDTTEASSPYLTWLTDHGGNQTSTRRRIAQLLLDDPEFMAMLMRSVVGVMVDELNAVRANFTIPMTARTLAQARTAIKNKIAAGTVDS